MNISYLNSSYIVVTIVQIIILFVFIIKFKVVNNWGTNRLKALLQLFGYLIIVISVLWNLSSWYVNYNIVKGRTAFEDKAYDSAIRHYNYALLGIKYTKFFSIIPFFSLIEKEKIT